MVKMELAQFKQFLIERRFANAQIAPHFCRWVDKFLTFSQGEAQLGQDERKSKFLGLLEAAQIPNWQMNQAQEAIDLYFGHFKEFKVYQLKPEVDSGGSEQADILKKMRHLIRIKHFAYSTERSYLDWTGRFFDYVIGAKKKKPGWYNLDAIDVSDFLTYLAVNRRVSASTQNQAFNALLFLFRETLKIKLDDLTKAIRAKRGPKLPVVLSVSEVQKLFEYMSGKELLMAQLIYGAGLRLMELARLRVGDVDFDNKIIFVRSAKGDKDRTTVLPEAAVDSLRAHLKKVREVHGQDITAGFGEVYLPDAISRKYPKAPKEWAWQYVFPSHRLSVDPRSGKVRRHHVTDKAIQNMIAAAVKRAGIAKRATVHTLRHSFATHLLMDGVNIREIQELLGHKNVETTMVYTHVLKGMSNAPKSPLDNLYAVKEGAGQR